MMKKIIIRNITIVITVFTAFFIFAYGAREASAQTVICNSLKGRQVKTFDAHRSDVLDWTFNGNTCNYQGNFNQNKTCLGPVGGRYMAYYCNPLVDSDGNASPLGCEAENPEQSFDKAPAYCNRPDTGLTTDITRIFGQIMPPPAIQNFGFGAAGISKFLSNVIVLIYSLASIALIFMILWAAFEWLTSGGDKEKVAAARARLTYAIIGMILFAVAFAVIQVLGTFTGFKFFTGQRP